MAMDFGGRNQCICGKPRQRENVVCSRAELRDFVPQAEDRLKAGSGRDANPARQLPGIIRHWNQP